MASYIWLLHIYIYSELIAMAENRNKDLQLAIKVEFDKYPLLNKLVKNPTHSLHSPWTQLVSEHLQSQFTTSSEGDFYRIVFKPGATGELMTIQKGPLAGLKTTSVVEGGKITSMAALEKVDGQLAKNFIPMFLTLGALNSIHARLNYIADICITIRNRQISGDKAKLERISEVIADCFDSLSEGDEILNAENLRRVTINTDDCFEILSVLLDDLESQHIATAMDFESCDEHTGIIWYGDRKLANPTQAMRTLMRHSVFSAFERYVAGRACQVLLSGNYSLTNIGRHKRALVRVRDSIKTIFDVRMESFQRGAKLFRDKVKSFEEGYDDPNWTMEAAQRSLDRQLTVIKELENELNILLDSKIADFESLAEIFSRGSFEAIVIDGGMIFSDLNPPQLENEITNSPESFLSTAQIVQRSDVVHSANDSN
ncbi:hypothetical protein CUC49_12835 [Citrobacter pasteurii]|nr:hypothetical protein CUC49_12835 [Citrobacter pasteurii]